MACAADHHDGWVAAMGLPNVRTPTSAVTLPTPTGTLTATLTVIPNGTSLATPQSANQPPNSPAKQGLPGVLDRVQERLRRLRGR